MLFLLFKPVRSFLMVLKALRCFWRLFFFSQRCFFKKLIWDLLHLLHCLLLLPTLRFTWRGFQLYWGSFLISAVVILLWKCIYSSCHCSRLQTEIHSQIIDCMLYVNYSLNNVNLYFLRVLSFVSAALTHIWSVCCPSAAGWSRLILHAVSFNVYVTKRETLLIQHGYLNVFDLQILWFCMICALIRQFHNATLHVKPIQEILLRM